VILVDGECAATRIFIHHHHSHASNLQRSHRLLPSETTLDHAGDEWRFVSNMSGCRSQSEAVTFEECRRFVIIIGGEGAVLSLVGEEPKHVD